MAVSVRGSLHSFPLTVLVALVQWGFLVSGTPSGQVIVDLPSLGRVLGTRVETPLGIIDNFLGMRYARVAQRFDASHMFSDTTSTYDATKYGAWCHQTPYPGPAHEYSEDCLFLNVQRSSPVNTPKAVMVWIHGGSFVTGGSANPLFDGTHLAISKKIVVVSINYRLGPLGFLVHNASGAGGMNGLGDMVVALRWIQLNIGSFGGDAGRVTIFGESAGGCAVCSLAVAPVAKGLFRGAIVESGPCFGSWAPETKALGLAQKDALMAQHHVLSLDGLRKVPAANLTWPLPTGGYFLDDGAVLAEAPIDIFKRDGTHVKVFAIGGNSDDDTPELNPPPLFPPRNATEAQYRLALRLRFGLHASAVEKQYPMSRFNESAVAAFTQADSDAVVTCPSLDIASAAANPTGTGRSGQNTSVYVYRFAHLQRQCDGAAWINDVPEWDKSWASHGSEIAFVFNNTHFINALNGSWVHCLFTNQEKVLSSRMMSLWASIADKAAPVDSSPHPVQWPRFLPGKGALTLEFATPLTKPMADVKSDDCAFWASISADAVVLV